MSDTAPPTATASVPPPSADAPVVSDTATLPAEPDTAEYIAKSPIFINGVRAYNENDPVTADAVKKNNLKDFVKKA